MTDQEFDAKFPWVKAYEALAQALKGKYEKLTKEQKENGDYSPIVSMVKEAFAEADVEYYPKTISPAPTDKDIDPFSIFGFFNNCSVQTERRKVVAKIMEKFEVKVGVKTPNFVNEDFLGIPILQQNKVLNFEIATAKKNILLWKLFNDIVNWEPQNNDPGKLDELAKQIQEIEKKIGGFSKSHLYLFWVQPTKFLSLDKRSTKYLDFKNFDGLDADTMKTNVVEYLKKCTEITREVVEKRPFASFVEFSESAWEFSSDVIGKAERLLVANHNLVLTGAPGTGKTYTAKKVACKLTGDNADAEEQAHIQSVQFHPNYDYSDFIGGLRPQPTEDKKNVLYPWRPGVFTTFANKALQAYKKWEKEKNGNAPKYVFIIDEINRADLSRVFGETFSLLEADYRYPRKKNGLALPGSGGEEFILPENLYIIGTMNDIDRSVESMDFALRRRFAWLEVEAGESKRIIEASAKEKGIDPKIVAKLKDAMNALNECIRGEKEPSLVEKTDKKTFSLKSKLGPEYELGGAYFAKFDGKKHSEEAYEKLWDNHLEIILKEYLRGEKDKDDIVDALHKVYISACGFPPDK